MAHIHNYSRPMSTRVVASILGLLLLSIPLVSCGTSVPTPLRFVPIDLGLPPQALNAPTVGPLPDTTTLHISVTFKINQAILNSLNSQKIQPGHPSHLENLANRLGISDATYQKIKAFFNLQGVTLKLSKLRTNLTINAKAKTFAHLFQTHFVIHRLNGRTFYAPATPPKLPEFLASSIVAITGLDNYSASPRRWSQFQHFTGTKLLTRPGQDCNADSRTLLPKEVAHAYGYDSLWNRGLHGENMTVNLVEIDGVDRNDIQNYLDCINFQGKVSVADIDSPPTQAEGESTLDIQMIAGLARSINIVDYETDGNTPDDIWTSVNDELQQIINDNTNNANSGEVVSISLGDTERDITSADRAAIDQSFQVLTKAEHMTIFVASGDCAAFTDGTFHSLSVSFPASDPWVVSVGGTELSINGSQSRANEVVWSDGSNTSKCTNQWGSGGGNSIVFQRPSWQTANGVNNQFARGMRQIPDISAVAYGLAIYFQGQWGAVGGTSAAAPIWAAGMELVNEGLIKQQSKFAYSPQLFYLADDGTNDLNAYFDVTRGNNLYFPATPGWDYASGLGSPNLANFYNAISAKIR
jgi:kumamolisin